MGAGIATASVARNFCWVVMWSPDGAEGQPLSHPNTRDEEVGGCLRKREELSLRTLPPLIDASTSMSHDTQDP